MTTFYATFDGSGPFRKRYAVVKAEQKRFAWLWLKLHFPLDLASLYEQQRFDELFQGSGFTELFQYEIKL